MSEYDGQKKTHTFHFDAVGVDGVRREGKFTVKKMNISDLRRVGILETELNGGYYTVFDDQGNPTGRGLNPTTSYINSMWAQCKVALITKPDWFDDEILEDVTILEKVFREVNQFENSFRKRGRDGSKREENSQNEPEGQEELAEIPDAMVAQDLPTIHKKR